MTYDKLLKEASDIGVDVIDFKFSNNLTKGLYANNTIALNESISTNKEKSCILAEELGHHHTTYGQILDFKDIKSLKQEKRARNWAYEKLIGIVDLINAHRSGVRNRYELAEYLNVTEDFLESTLTHFSEKYGLYYEIDNYLICFQPLIIIEKFENI